MTEHTNPNTPDLPLDEDLLVGFVEGRLLPGERELVERHLASCSVTREFVAALTEEQGQPPAVMGYEATPPPLRAVPGPSLSRTLPWLAAAAALILFFLLPGGRQETPATTDTAIAEAMLAADAAELFTTLRSPAPLTDTWHLGVRLDEATTLRVVAVLDDGRTMVVPLDGNGAGSLDLDPDANHAFGPYPTAFDGARVGWLLVIAGGDADEVDALRATLEDAGDLAAAVAALADAGGDAQVEVLALD